MRRAIGRRAIGALAAVLVVLTVAACGGSDPHSLVLYNGQHPQLTDALVSAFEKQTGVHVSVRTNDGIVLADQLLQEGNASPADVYITENSPELVDLDEHHLLARLNPTTLDQTPARFRTPTGDWIGMALRVSGLAYDPARISASQLPVSVLDLAQPQWKGKIAIAPTDSDFPPVVGAVIARYGTKAATDWLAGLKRNAQLYASDEAVVAAVNRGDVATGVINHYYWYRLGWRSGLRRSTAPSTTSPATTWDRSRTSPGPPCSGPAAARRRRRSSSTSWSAARARRSSPVATTSSTRPGPG